MEQENVNQENSVQEKQEQQKSEQPAQSIAKQQSPNSTKGFIHIKKIHFSILLVILVLATAGITMFALTIKAENIVVVDNNRKEFEKLYSAFDTLKQEYFKEIKDSTLINGAIEGMIESLDDPYSDYMSIEEAGNFHQSISSSFEGIGAEIEEKEGHILIVSPIKGSPAEKAGLKPGDIVLMVDGKSLKGKSSTEAVALIRGEKDTKVELTIQRPGMEDTMKVTLVRDTIPIETVHGELLEDGIAHVQIATFSKNTTQELVNTLNEFNNKGMKGLVLDLRQNPGGLLDQAINISSLFVPYGEILFKVEDRNGNVKEYKSNNKNTTQIPLVVLINKGSASASEILAAAVSESANVSLVGEKSFGKGTVQRAQDFPDGSNIKFTTEKWLTPKGNWIHEKGITPNYEVKLPEYASLTYIDPEREWKISSSSNDVKVAQQMLRAIGYNPGREDGFFDEKTKQAITAFQKDKKLEVNGVLSGNTTMVLMESLRNLLEKNDSQMQKAVELLKKELGI